MHPFERYVQMIVIHYDYCHYFVSFLVIVAYLNCNNNDTKSKLMVVEQYKY
jgi:hypothetical protein